MGEEFVLSAACTKNFSKLKKVKAMNKIRLSSYFEIRQRTRTLIHKRGSRILIGAMLLLLIIVIIEARSNLGQVFNDGILNLVTEILGTLLIIYFGINKLTLRDEIDALPELPKSQVIREISKATERVQIYESFTMLAVDGRRKAFQEAIVQAFMNGADIKIIILEPDSKGLKQRSKELIDLLPVKDLHEQNLLCFHYVYHDIIHEISEDWPETSSIEVKFTQDLPGSTMYVMDKFLYLAPFPRSDRADLSKQLRFEIAEEDSIGEGFRADFDRAWENEEKILDDFLMAKVLNVRDQDYLLHYVSVSPSILYAGYIRVNDRLRNINYESLSIDLVLEDEEYIVQINGQSGSFRFSRVEQGQEVIVMEHFSKKYGELPLSFEVILRLHPVSP